MRYYWKVRRKYCAEVKPVPDLVTVAILIRDSDVSEIGDDAIVAQFWKYEGLERRYLDGSFLFECSVPPRCSFCWNALYRAVLLGYSVPSGSCLLASFG